jgi:nuclear pore complex protein Nup155
MLLAIAAGNTFVDTESLQASITNPDLAAVAKQVFYDFGDRPVWTERVTYGKGQCIVLTLRISWEVEQSS